METFKQEVSRHSFDSLDIDLEGKAMLQRDSLDHHRRRVSMAAAEADFRRQPLSSTNPKRRRFNALILPASVAANAVLFAFALFLLAHPCYFSARNCVYRQEDGKGEAVVDDGLKLMGEINGLVPECECPKKGVDLGPTC